MIPIVRNDTAYAAYCGQACSSVGASAWPRASAVTSMISSVAAIAKRRKPTEQLRVIRTVWLDNPPVNASNPDVIAAIRAAVEEPGEGTRVLVLRGRGERAFSAGADISGFKESEGGAGAIQRTA